MDNVQSKTGRVMRSGMWKIRESIRPFSLRSWVAFGLVTLAVSLAFAKERSRLWRSEDEGPIGATSIKPIAVESAPLSSSAEAIKTKTRHAVTINRPLGPPVIRIDGTDPHGRQSSIACSTCHGLRPANYANRVPADLDQFHQQMKFSHGKLACFACHNPKDYDSLRLADETVLGYPDVMTLCSQCHGQEARAYEHGAHGGMNGYWDLSRGARTRNNCIYCHDPHVPKYPSMQTTFKPRDRFLNPDGTHQKSNHGSH